MIVLFFVRDCFLCFSGDCFFKACFVDLVDCSGFAPLVVQDQHGPGGSLGDLGSKREDLSLSNLIEPNGIQ